MISQKKIHSAGKKVLLAEDDTFIRELYQRVLTQVGFVVIPAIDGAEALEKAHELPDLILLDVMMPKMNGIEVLTKLKEDPKLKDITVILLTNLGAEKIIKQAFDLGARGYMMKMRKDPYEIIDEVDNYLQHPDFRMNYKESLGE